MHGAMVTKDADMFFYGPIFRVRLISIYFNNQGAIITCARKHVRALEMDPAGSQVLQEGLQDDDMPALCNMKVMSDNRRVHPSATLGVCAGCGVVGKQG